jgi:hypothetical protein
MNPFELTVSGILYTVEPQGEDRYLIFEAGIKIGEVFTDITDEGIVWRSSDLITPEQANKFGEAIENYEVDNKN